MVVPFSTCYVAFNPQKEESSQETCLNVPKTYRLPDGQVISLGPERFRAPEILFNPGPISGVAGHVVVYSFCRQVVSNSMCFKSSVKTPRSSILGCLSFLSLQVRKLWLVSSGK